MTGEAGVGKSRLVSELASEARESGSQVLFGRAVQAEIPVPFRPFSEALLSHFRSQGPPDLPALAPFRPALGRLLPEWRTPGETTHEPLVVLAEGVVRLLTAVAGQDATLLVLENLHWADQETLSVVEYFADVLPSQPVLCLATLRPEDGSIIKVRRAVTRTADGFVVGLPKSAAGVRDVAIPPHLLPMLREHLTSNITGGREGLLFPAAGDPTKHLAPGSLCRVFYSAREAAGRPDARWHDLRHTGAVLAAQTGASLAELMGRLGHSTPGAALIYQHAAAGRDAQIAAALSRLVEVEAT